MDYKVPETWDWIHARTDCSIKQMFLLLVARIDDDVKQMESLARAKQATSVYTLNRISETKIIVARKDDIGGLFNGRGVAVECVEAGIVAYKTGMRGDEGPFLNATPMLSADGKCRFHISKQPMELWQVSDAALADLFFERWRE